MPAAVETMAYVGATPWHGLGVDLPANPTVAQMRQAAGLTWEPVIRPLTYEIDGTVHGSHDRALVRDDTGDELDIVGPTYVPIKNSEVVEFFRSYAEAGSLTLETAGVLDGGRYVWCLARMDADIAVGGEQRDTVASYVFLANPHIYGRGAIAKYTAVRIVCKNTLQMALSGPGGVKIWHTSAFDEARRSDVARDLGLAHDHRDRLAREAEILAETKVTEKVARRVIAKAFNKTAPTKPEDASPVESRVYALYAGAGKGADLPTAKGTAWGVLNAVTQYIDWERGKTPNNRLRGSWFGDGNGIKVRAQKELLSHAVKRGKAN